MSKIKDYFYSLNLDYKKELIKIILINLLLIVGVTAAYIFSKQILILCIGIAIFLAYNVFLFRTYLVRKDILKVEHDDELISLFAYLKIFISNHINVYSSFQYLKSYSSEWMEEQITYLLENIDNDKSIKPYIDFAHNFVNPLIENLMVSIYQLVEQGNSENRFTTFEILFSKLSDLSKENKINNKKKKLDNLSVYPLIGAGFITLLILFAVFSGLNEVMINVL